MSDTNNIENTSFLSNLKNKLLYKAQKAVYDPDANNYVSNKQTIVQQQSNSTDNSTDNTNQTDTSTDNTSQTGQSTDTNGSFFNMIFWQTINQIQSLAAKIIIPFISLLIAMFVVNDMIVYPRPIRVIMFITVFLLCIFMPFYTGAFIIYYVFKIIYAWYKRNLSEKIFKDGKEIGSKHRYMPKIFALLPITTTQPCSSLGRFFYYAFNYPKYDSEDYDKGGALKGIMDDYLSSLKDSFTDFDKYKSNPLFGKLLGRVEDNFRTMHKKEVKECIIPSETSKEEQQDAIISEPNTLSESVTQSEAN